MRGTAALALAAMLGGAGCMNYVVRDDSFQRSQDASRFGAMFLGALGDGALAAGGAGIHASSSDTVTFREAFPIYAGVLIASDLLVFLITQR